MELKKKKCHSKDHKDIHEFVFMHNFVLERLELLIGRKQAHGLRMMSKLNPVFVLMEEVCFQFLDMKMKLKCKSRKSS